MTDEKMKEWIDKSDYETLLRKWRFHPIGDPLFVDEVGDHYEKVMFEKRDLLEDNGVAASKKVGW